VEKSEIPPLPDTRYWRAYQGKFQGVLTWNAFDDLWQVLAASDGSWYVYDLDGPAPQAPTELGPALHAARQMYDEVRNRSYCGTVYVDDPQAPRFVKVFDPYKMGATCGSSGERTMPRYVFSQIKPDALPAPEPPAAPGFWKRFARQG